MYSFRLVAKFFNVSRLENNAYRFLLNISDGKIRAVVDRVVEQFVVKKEEIA